MYTISLISQAYDPDGCVRITPLPAESPGDYTRRVNAVKTLDAGVAVSDGGFSEADRTLTYSWKRLAPAEHAKVVALFKTYSRLNLATEEGFFVVAPLSLTNGAGQTTINLQVVEKVA